MEGIETGHINSIHHPILKLFVFTINDGFHALKKKLIPFKRLNCCAISQWDNGIHKWGMLKE